jgi:signal transduction histidine kinase
MSRGTKAATAGDDARTSAGAPKHERTDIGGLEQRLAEAIEQEAATSRILRVMAQSPGDVQPIFDSIANSALELCRASSAVVFTFDGTLIHIAALASVHPEGAEAIRNAFPKPPGRETAAARAVLTRKVATIPDVLIDADYRITQPALAAGFRSTMSVPLLRDGRPIGAIGVGRPEPGAFPDEQIAMLETFADQAVIAIENARLFHELQARNRDVTDALEQQTATSEILRAISGSPTDVQPVFDIIAERAVKLCSAEVSVVSRLDGETIRLAALNGVTAQGTEAIGRAFPMRRGAQTVSARAIRNRAVVNVFDVLADQDYETKEAARAGGFRGSLGVPMVCDGEVIGAIFVARSQPGLFSDRQIELLELFAAQAVIAVQNVRLFGELQTRTRQLTRSVEELKALGEVGQAVSSTLDLATVLSTIAARATQLAGVDGGSIYEYDEARETFHLHTAWQLPEALVQALRADPIRRGEGVLGRMAATLEPVQVPDIADEAAYQSRVRELLIRAGYRSLLAVPLLREDRLLGGLAVNRKIAGAFEPEVIELLKKFATQSALAIQNAQLFREIEQKGRELEKASRHKSEFLTNMSHELRTPLNAIIGFSEVLAERMFGDVNDKQAEYLTDILESARHLLSLINDILDLSKIEAGRMELEPTSFDLTATIENTLILVRERAQRRSIELAKQIDGRLGVIEADERKVKQVLLNLLSNALKFTPEGGRIDVHAGVRDAMAEISVTDNGVGIAPQDQEAVFEEFRQVGALTRKVEGTGLGLAISRKFIELHGGRIRVSSTPGAGSTFTFTLPIRQPRPEK